MIKEEYLNNLFSREVLVLANDDPFHYRDRMDFVYQNGSLGLRKKGDFKTVIPIDTCHLIPREFQDSCTKVQNLLKKYQFPHYDIQDHTGFLRYIVFRYAESTNQLMLIITTANPVDDQEEKLNAFIKELSARSIYWLVSDSITDVSIPVVSPRLIQGEKTIQEKIGNYLFHISPYSFFQANVKMAARIFEEIKEELRGPTVDLCCGVGSIGLFVSEKATSITGIEEVAPAIDLAKQNKELNRNTNATFFASDMKNILDFTPLDVQTLIVDPPRAGLGKKVVKRIKE
ncbi:MAG: class I SAM-dependent RNA methyltransferase, partial [Simkania sp.]|nr:class I SAM-dependent RNA methyltransferase [Simkania sp.]